MSISLLIDTVGGSNFENKHLRNVASLHVGGAALAVETLDVTGTVGVSNKIKVDTVNEFTSATGVTVDGVVIKDSGATFAGDIVQGNGFGVIIGHTALLAIAETTAELQVLGTGDADSAIAIGRYSANVTSGSLLFYKSRAVIGSLATVVSGDELGAIRVYGDDGTDANTRSSSIIFDTEGTISTGQVPGIIRLQVAAAGTLADALTIDSAKAVVMLGTVGIGSLTTGTIFNIEPGVAARDLVTGIGTGLHIEADTQAINAAGNGETKAIGALAFFGIPTWTSVGTTLTITDAATVYIQGVPVGSTNTTVSNAYALWVDAGTSRFDGPVELVSDRHFGTTGSDSILINHHAGGDMVYYGGGTVAVWRINTGGLMLVNDSANANMTIGLTINMGANDNQIFCLKSSDVATGLTSAPAQDVETDDFFTINKLSADEGGVRMQVLTEDGGSAKVSFELNVEGATAETIDTTLAVGLVNIRAREHDGANAFVNAPANQNLLTIQAHAGGAAITRLLLKGDDGELHLGNTTLVALEDYDDAQLVQAMRRESSTEVNPWGVPVYNYDVLHKIGVLGEKDNEGNCLFAVQPRFAMNEGAIWQNYVGLQLVLSKQDILRDEQAELRDRLEIVEQKLLAA